MLRRVSAAVDLDAQPLAGRVLDALLEGLDGFRLDQGHLAPAEARPRGVVTAAQEVPIALQALAGHGADLGDDVERRARLTGDLQRNHLTLPHGPHYKIQFATMARTLMTRDEGLPPAYSQALETRSLRPLWTALHTLLPAERSTRAVPHLWRWRDLRPMLLGAAQLVPIDKAERRVLVLTQPGARR